LQFFLFDRLKQLRHPAYQILKQQPSALHEERDELILGILDQKLDSRKLADVKVTNKVFPLLSTYLGMSHELYSDRQGSSRYSIDQSNERVKLVKDVLRDIFQKMLAGTYTYSWKKVDKRLKGGVVVSSKSELTEKTLDDFPSFDNTPPDFHKIKGIRTKLLKHVGQRMVWRGDETFEEEDRVVQGPEKDEVPVEEEEIQVILSDEELDELDNLARRDFVVEEVSEEDEIY